MSNATVQRQYDTLILGDGADGFFDMNPKKLQLNNNLLVIGGTGTQGKPKVLWKRICCIPITKAWWYC